MCYSDCCLLPTQSNPWMDPFHVQIWYERSVGRMVHGTNGLHVARIVRAGTKTPDTIIMMYMLMNPNRKSQQLHYCHIICWYRWSTEATDTWRRRVHRFFNCCYIHCCTPTGSHSWFECNGTPQCYSTEWSQTRRDTNLIFCTPSSHIVVYT